MNTKEYIESGILEAYVLDALPDEEAQQVAANIAMYPELADEVAAIEVAMQEFAESIAEEPPVDMQDKIWSAIQKDSVAESAQKAAPQIIPLQRSAEVRNTGWQRAAVLVALVGSLLLNYLFWSQKKDASERQAALTRRVDSMQQTQQQLATLVGQYKAAGEMKADTAMQTIVMQTAQKGHPMAATVYWNKTRGEAYVALDKLPEPPKGMQYQLWVMQDGKPVDMGTLPNEMVNTANMHKVTKAVAQGQAFAISLEKEGGSPVPTMTNIYVMGKAAS